MDPWTDRGQTACQGARRRILPEIKRITRGEFESEPACGHVGRPPTIIPHSLHHREECKLITHAARERTGDEAGIGELMIDVEKAKRLILDAVSVGEIVEVETRGAVGRVLAEEIPADRDFPPTDRSAMDGFAVRSGDVLEPGQVLAIADELSAGRSAEGVQVQPGSCVRIMTGAVMPEGADAVVMVEDTEEDRGAGTVAVGRVPEPGQHVRARGRDVRAGDRVLARGAPVHAAEIAALASVGRTRVKIFRPPVVRVLSTGDELVPPDCRPADHQIRNSSTWALLAQLSEIGLEGEDLAIAPDDRPRLDAAVREGLSGDVLLVTGGVSAGEYDLVGEALEEAGVDILFHKIAVKPGKPILVGRRGGCLVVGLPGNPVSTFTGFAVFVAPALRRMMGYARWDNLEITAVLAERLKRRPGRTTYHLARVSVEDDRVTALPVRSSGSGDVLSLSRANAFIVTPAEAGPMRPGQRVPAVLWKDFHLR